MKRTNKKEIYEHYGIEYANGKIKSEKYGFVNEMLIDGNAKIGKGCYHFSMLPTNQLFNVIVNNMSYTVKGTCVCNCKGCYATKGNYRFQSTINSLGIRTLLVREELDFVERAIKAQIEADHIEAIRIHASGDFDSKAYLDMWIRIVSMFPNVKFWTYTKVREFENAFNGFENANIVKSTINGYGFNFGHCDYIMSVYKYLISKGKKVHICFCGVEQAAGVETKHCTNCKCCSECEYVLFLEHSTEYKAENDPLFMELVKLVMSQKYQ